MKTLTSVTKEADNELNEHPYREHMTLLYGVLFHSWCIYFLNSKVSTICWKETLIATHCNSKYISHRKSKHIPGCSNITNILRCLEGKAQFFLTLPSLYARGCQLYWCCGMWYRMVRLKMMGQWHWIAFPDFALQCVVHFAKSYT